MPTSMTNGLIRKASLFSQLNSRPKKDVNSFNSFNSWFKVGSGRFAEKLSIEYGVDPSIKLLAKAKARGIKVKRGVGEKIPYKDKSFGAVFVIFTLCFVTNPKKVLNEAYRVLKANGSIIIGFIPKNSPWGKFYQKKVKTGHPIYSQVRFYAFKEVKDLLKENFQIKEIVSTLIQTPGKVQQKEHPKKNYISNAGFIVIRAKHRLKHLLGYTE